MPTIKDNTALIPFVLFIIFAGIVTYAIVKGSPKKLSQEELDKLYANT